MSYEEFQRALRDAGRGLTKVAASGRDVRITDLRHALGDSVSHGEFDDSLRRLRSDGLVALTPHAQPALLDSLARQGSFVDGPDIFYFLRWLS